MDFLRRFCKNGLNKKSNEDIQLSCPPIIGPQYSRESSIIYCPIIGVKYAERNESGRDSIAIEEGGDTDKSRQDGFIILQGMWYIGWHLA
jgi:hypothetical protein